MADKPRRSGALLVSIGILCSRLLGLVRTTFMARYFGATEGIAADAFTMAFRIPNMLQNLLGEGVLSASFIPVYARLLVGDDAIPADSREADRVAGAIGAALGLIAAIVVVLGVVSAPLLVTLIAHKYTGDKRALTIELTRIFFPGAGFFVLSAWCLGILNSHRRFLLSYMAPALYNVAMIVALVWYGPRLDLGPLAVAAAWASVVGAALQFLVQVPTVVRLAPHLSFRPDMGHVHVRSVLRAFVPVAISRGVLQISGTIDQIIAGLLPNGSVALLGNAQIISMLPVSLFGMAISAAALPEMSSTVGSASERALLLRSQLVAGLRNISFFVIPSAVAFLAFGDVIIKLLFQHGRFHALDTHFAWGILAGSSVGLLAQTLGRLYSSTFYALHDTRTPLKYALVRLSLTGALGYLFAVPLPGLLHIDPHWGAAGLTITAGMAGWVEFALLRRGIEQRIGPASAPQRLVIQLWAIALVSGAVAFGVKTLMSDRNRYLGAAAVIGVFGILYLGGAMVARVPEIHAIKRRIPFLG